MNGRRTARVLAAGVLCGTLLLSAGTALADTASPVPSPSPGAEPTSLPGVAQSLPDFRQNGCRKGSGRITTRIPWAQAYLRPEAAWPLSQGGGVTVAVVGSGVDDASGALSGRLTVAPRQYDAGPAPDCVGHGTFVAGLIAAGRVPGVGFAGIAPQARILAVGVTDQAGTTNAELLAQGIRAAVDGGARVVDIAAPAAAGSPALAAAVRYALDKGAVVVAPATADAPGRPGASYPAAYPGVLAVASIGPGGTPGQDTPAGRVDLVAPGQSVMSTGPAGTGYFTATGPSCATAFVAGAAALALGHRPRLTGPQLVHRLESTAYHAGTAVPDPRVGYGTVDPVAAVSAVLPEERDGAVPPALATGDDLAMPPVAGRSAAGGAFLVGGVALAVTALVAGAGAVLPRGRRRGWRPGGP
ncbi:S8 family serine peptidase [Streptomyces sp.]|uniref:S8 family serine peptidase n=1 Tax=Streptomyces sp. TaxID=1931 RepID=UPI002F42F73F